MPSLSCCELSGRCCIYSLQQSASRGAWKLASTGDAKTRSASVTPTPTRHTPCVRIGTWNLQGRWDARHLDRIESMRCDVLLLTEVSERVEIPEMTIHLSRGRMAATRRWAAVASPHSLLGLRDPHGASALAEIDGRRMCSSILPWRFCGTSPPWIGKTTADETTAAVAALESASPYVWGGDWNHALSGRE